MGITSENDFTCTRVSPVTPQSFSLVALSWRCVRSTGDLGPLRYPESLALPLLTGAEGSQVIHALEKA